MKNCVIRASTNNWYLYLCHTWRGKLTWTLSPSRQMVLTLDAANSMMQAIKDIVPHLWKLDIVDPTNDDHAETPFTQEKEYYLENFPNI